MIKKLFGWPLCWYFFGAGHIGSRIMELFENHERWVSFWYPIYNENMIFSHDIQDWADGHGHWWPWGERQEHPTA